MIQDGVVLRSTLHPHLSVIKKKGKLDLTTVPEALLDGLRLFVAVHCPDLHTDGFAVCKKRGARTAILESGGRGCRLSELLLEHGADEINRLIHDDLIFHLPGTDVVFDRAVAVPAKQLGPVFLGAVVKTHHGGKR